VVAALGDMRQELAALIAGSNDPGQAQTRITEWAQRHAGSDAIALPIFRATALSDMAGQMFVRLIEVPETARSLDGETPAFLRMPFREAVEWFIDHFGDDDAVRRLLDGYRRRSDEATALLFQRVAERARDELQRTLEEGGTLDDFAAAIEAETTRLGIEPARPAYVETVFRSQVQGAYGAGRYKQMTTPAVMAARPGVEYRTIGDNRVCSICAPMDGKQWHITDAAWRRVAPPNHFNDRCSMVTLDEDEMDSAALRRRVTSEPDPAFDGPPDGLMERTIA